MLRSKSLAAVILALLWSLSAHAQVPTNPQGWPEFQDYFTADHRPNSYLKSRRERPRPHD